MMTWASGRVFVRAEGALNGCVNRAPSLRRIWPATWPTVRQQDAGGEVYLQATIHPRAGFAHQFASWLAAYDFARDQRLRLLAPSLRDGWSEWLGLDRLAAVPVSRPGRRISLPPCGDERDVAGRRLLGETVSRRRRPGAIFRLPLDFPLWDLARAVDDVRAAFAASSTVRAGGDGQLHVAVHIRRGDVDADLPAADRGLRFRELAWFRGPVGAALDACAALGRRVCVSIHSHGTVADVTEAVPEHPALARTHLDIDGDARESFRRLAAADILVCSPSGFSFSAGLLGRGVVVLAVPFWHRVPDGTRWVTYSDPADDDLAERVRVSLIAGGA